MFDTAQAVWAATKANRAHTRVLEEICTAGPSEKEAAQTAWARRRKGDRKHSRSKGASVKANRSHKTERSHVTDKKGRSKPKAVRINSGSLVQLVEIAQAENGHRRKHHWSARAARKKSEKSKQKSKETMTMPAFLQDGVRVAFDQETAEQWTLIGHSPRWRGTVHALANLLRPRYGGNTNAALKQAFLIAEVDSPTLVEPSHIKLGELVAHLAALRGTTQKRSQSAQKQALAAAEEGPRLRLRRAVLLLLQEEPALLRMQADLVRRGKGRLHVTRPPKQEQDAAAAKEKQETGAAAATVATAKAEADAAAAMQQNCTALADVNVLDDSDWPEMAAIAEAATAKPQPAACQQKNCLPSATSTGTASAA